MAIETSAATHILAIVAQNPGITSGELLSRCRDRGIAHPDAGIALLKSEGRITLEGEGTGAAVHLAGAKTVESEQGGRQGPEPTRFGDWESKGICVDF